jgi:hypothetical protein
LDSLAAQLSVAESNSGGLPLGNYEGKFVGVEYLPEKEADAMSGEGGRKWAKYAFKWEITEGEHKGKTAIRETTAKTTAKSDFTATIGLIMSKQLTAGSPYDLTAFVGRKYLVTIGYKMKQDGTATTWAHVSNAMLKS